jgi:hypothetical protein
MVIKMVITVEARRARRAVRGGPNGGHKVHRGPNTWRLHAFVGVDSKGKRRYATKTVHGTKREAGRDQFLVDTLEEPIRYTEGKSIGIKRWPRQAG